MVKIQEATAIIGAIIICTVAIKLYLKAKAEAEELAKRIVQAEEITRKIIEQLKE